MHQPRHLAIVNAMVVLQRVVALLQGPSISAAQAVPAAPVLIQEGVAAARRVWMYGCRCEVSGGGRGKEVCVVQTYTSSRYFSCTGCVKPGTVMTGHSCLPLAKYLAKRCVSMVALISTTCWHGIAKQEQNPC